ncbi:ABC transporter ATP-binding protein [Inquilinus limosus]|uniref:ABC transporter ATP-binding protein n=1 Tax=Inquilinus limosus TaxID=171674 RepID=UPI003F163222
MAEDVVLSARRLVKRYGDRTAVDGIDLEIRRGEIVGLLGPNGSGKTTTILMLLGLTEATSGEARVLGRDPMRDPLSVKRAVGYLPDAVGFYDGLSAATNLVYTARLAGIPRSEIRGRIDEALTRVDLAEHADRRVATFSRGMRQRLGLAEILMKRAEIAILDEPTAALDPHATHEFLQMIRGLRESGITVLLSSHHLDQVQSVCDRVALFHRGRIVLSGTVQDLAARVLGGGWVIDVATDLPGAETLLRGVPEVQAVTAVEPGHWRIQARSDIRNAVAAAVLGARGTVQRLGLAEPSLAEIYRRTFEEAGDVAAA